MGENPLISFHGEFYRSSDPLALSESDSDTVITCPCENDCESPPPQAQPLSLAWFDDLPSSQSFQQSQSLFSDHDSDVTLPPSETELAQTNVCETESDRGDIEWTVCILMIL